MSVIQERFEMQRGWNYPRGQAKYVIEENSWLLFSLKRQFLKMGQR